MKDWGTVGEAAEHYKVSRQRIHNVIKLGYLGEVVRVRLGTKRSLILIERPFKWAKKSAGRPPKKEGKWSTKQPK